MTTTPTREENTAPDESTAAPATPLPTIPTPPARRWPTGRRRRPTTATNPPVEVTPPGPLVPR